LILTGNGLIFTGIGFSDQRSAVSFDGGML